MSRAITYHRDRFEKFLGSKGHTLDEPRLIPPDFDYLDNECGIESQDNVMLARIKDSDRAIHARLPIYAIQVAKLTLPIGRFLRSGVERREVEELIRRGTLGSRLEAARKNRVRFFLISGMRVRSGMDHESCPIRIKKPTLLALFSAKLLILRYKAETKLEALRQTLAEAREHAEDRNLSAIAREFALTSLEVLMALIRSLSIGAFHLFHPKPPTNVLAAGGVNGGGKVQRGAGAERRPKWATPLV